MVTILLCECCYLVVSIGEVAFEVRDDISGGELPESVKVVDHELLRVSRSSWNVFWNIWTTTICNATVVKIIMVYMGFRS